MSPPHTSRPLLPKWIVPAVAVVVLAAAGVAGWLLWHWVDTLALADPEKKATAQLDVVKIAASIVVAGGGLFALYLAVRRQRTQELELEARHAELRHRQSELDQRDRIQAHTEQVAETNRLHAERVATNTEWDAAARRVTELYSTSVGQLGSDRAAVRLGGMYALERLAQDNPHQRQTVVNVLCAYLRMPYSAPGDRPALRRIGGLRAPFKSSPRGFSAIAPASTPRPGADEELQEREVRLTAQRLLATHLIPQVVNNGSTWSLATFWPDIDLDLSGATLIDFVLSGCAVRTFQADRARFIGPTSFAGTAFAGFVTFPGATFTGPVDFEGATFAGPAHFDGVTFGANAPATFNRDYRFHPFDVGFRNARFTAEATFSNATFTGATSFENVVFAGIPKFFGARFSWTTTFSGARFEGAVFARSSFAGHAGFERATFEGVTSFDSARFSGETRFDETRFAVTTWFRDATFDREPWFDGALAKWSERTWGRPSTWPPGWRLSDEPVAVEGSDGSWRALERIERDEPVDHDRLARAGEDAGS